MQFANDHLNLEAPDLSAVDLFNLGRANDNAAREAQESSKKFTLRAGNAGCLTTEGYFIGANPWKTLARFMGYQVKPNRQSLDIFDGGHGNEVIWDRYLTQVPGIEVKADTNYPLSVPNFARSFTLTGRPDAVIISDGVPRMGIELKGIFGASTAQNALAGSPKTDNLCQAAVYSAGFQLPWTLVYSNSSNFKTYKGPGAPVKSEFKLFWIRGKLHYLWEDNPVETIIDVQGLREYYEAIAEAYETKDHSWFKRSSLNYLGDEEPYNVDSYCEFSNLVDHTAPWSDWVKECEYASRSDRLIKYATHRGKVTYSVYDRNTMRTEREFDRLEDARNYVRKGWK